MTENEKNIIELYELIREQMILSPDLEHLIKIISEKYNVEKKI